jgi:hypothetical protein
MRRRLMPLARSQATVEMSVSDLEDLHGTLAWARAEVTDLASLCQDLQQSFEAHMNRIEDLKEEAIRKRLSELVMKEEG